MLTHNSLLWTSSINLYVRGSLFPLFELLLRDADFCVTLHACRMSHSSFVQSNKTWHTSLLKTLLSGISCLKTKNPHFEEKRTLQQKGSVMDWGLWTLQHQDVIMYWQSEHRTAWQTANRVHCSCSGPFTHAVLFFCAEQSRHVLGHNNSLDYLQSLAK